MSSENTQKKKKTGKKLSSAVVVTDAFKSEASQEVLSWDIEKSTKP